MHFALVAAGATLLAAGPAFAVPTIFFGEDLAPANGQSIPNAAAARAAFDAAFAGNVAVEDFEAYAGGLLPDVAPYARPTATFSGPAGTILGGFDQAGGVIVSTLATSGTKVYSDDEDFLFVDTFTLPAGPIGGLAVDGFGFFGIDIDGPLTLTVVFGDDTTSDFAIGNALSLGNIFFFGLTDPRGIALVSAGLPLNSGLGTFSMDDLVVGLQVPEPGALALFGLGLGVLALRRR